LASRFGDGAFLRYRFASAVEPIWLREIGIESLPSCRKLLKLDRHPMHRSSMTLYIN
jgi:hypothetical protein